MQALAVGNVVISSVTDGAAPFPFMPLATMYPAVPAVDWEPFQRRYPDCFDGQEHVRWAYQSFLVRSQGTTVLVDTGVGALPNPFLPGVGGVLLEHLGEVGCAPEDVDVVFLTHLHIDHVGWNLTADGKPTFPNARYVMHRDEWESFHRPEALADPLNGHISHFVTPLSKLGVLDLLEGDTDLTQEVTAICTPGHTEGHMSVVVSSEGEQAVITGDVIGHPSDVTEPDWARHPAFEHDSERANRTRKALLDRIETGGMTMAAGHLPEPGFGRIVRLEGRRWWQPV